MRTVGLDPSLSSFGWCLLGEDCRVIERGRIASDPKSLFVARYRWLRGEIHALLARHGPVRAGLESPIFGGTYSEGLYALFVQTMEALWISGVDVVLFSPSTLKSYVRDYLESDGLGVPALVDKAEMIEAARRLTGDARWSSDEADAYHAARQAARFWDLVDGRLSETQLLPKELRSFLGMRRAGRGPLKGMVVARDGLVFREGDRFFRFSDPHVRGEIPHVVEVQR